MKYNVRIKLQNGTLAVLTHRDRDQWGIKTARKHCRGVNNMILNGTRPEYRYAVVALA